MKYNESFTFLNYINQANPIRTIWYSVANNHVLSSILIKLSTIIFGSEIIAIRLPALIAGISCIVITYLICKQLNQNGLIGSLIVAISPYMVSFSSNARGYTLLTLFSLLLFGIALKVRKTENPNHVLGLSVISSLGMLVMPTMLFPVSGIYLWIIICLYRNNYGFKNITRKFILPCFSLTSLITLSLYSPVFIVSGGISSVTNGYGVNSIGFSNFLQKLYPSLLSTFSTLKSGIPSTLVILFLILNILGLYFYKRNSQSDLIVFLPIVLFSSFTIILLKQVIPPERSWIFLIPFLSIYADAGFSFITRFLDINSKHKFICLILLFSLFVSRASLQLDGVSSNDEDGFPEAPVAIKYIASTINEPTNEKINVITPASPEAPPLTFYQWYYDAPISINGISLERKSNSALKSIGKITDDFLKFLKIRPRTSFDESLVKSNLLYIIDIKYHSIESLMQSPSDKFTPIFKYGDMIMYKKS